MRIFVVGATGVLGRSLLPMLQQQEHTIRTVVRSPEQMQRLQQQGVEALQGDLLAEETVQRLPYILQGCDAALHIATAIPRNMRSPDAPAMWEKNTRLRIEGTQHLLQSALRAGVRRYIQQSITLAYADGADRWLDEQAPFDTSPESSAIVGPVVTMEEMIKKVPLEQLQWSILRGGSFVGPETMQDDQLENLRKGRLQVACDGSNYLSLVHVADMATACLLALQSPTAGRILNIVDTPILNRDYLDGLAKRLGLPQPQRNPKQPCPPSQRCSNQAAHALLGWTPTHGIWPTIY